MVIRKRQSGTRAIIEKYEMEPASISPPSRKKSRKLLRKILKYFTKIYPSIICHSGLSGIFLKNNPLTPFSKGESEGFPTRFTCGNDTWFINLLFIPLSGLYINPYRCPRKRKAVSQNFLYMPDMCILYCSRIVCKDCKRRRFCFYLRYVIEFY